MQLTIEKIASKRKFWKKNQSTHKGYVDNIKQSLEFEFGDFVLLEVCLLSCNEIWGKKN